MARERAVAISVGILIATLFLTESWVFGAGRQPKLRAPLWQALLSDRLTLGLVRMVAAVLALYVLGSVAVLVSRGRWMRAISTSGLEAETASDLETSVALLETEVDELRRDNRDLVRMLWRRGRG